MRGGVERRVRAWWDGEGGALAGLLRVALAPLAWAYGRVVGWRNRRWDARPAQRVEGVHVVSVGNLAVGGTGKTPLAAWTVEVLAGAGRRVAVVSRGYGRDELLLHQRWHPSVPVWASPDRTAAVRRAREGGAEAVVVDDGFQHRRLGRDVDLVLLAAEDPFPPRLLPVGPYREPLAALGRAHGVVVTRKTAPEDRARAVADFVRSRWPEAVVARLRFVPGGWRTLDGRPGEAPTGATLVAAGVGRPRSVAEMCSEATGHPAELMAFPDHHEFTEADARAMRRAAGARPVVVTEKDAVKLLHFTATLGDVRVLVQRIVWEEGEAAVRALVAGGRRAA